MDDREPTSERPDGEFHALIRAGLVRVLASDAFRAAPQLSAFLGFIVERAIEGRSSELKGYTIAVEAFGRSADFDPQTDPIVRVEAGRLRRALAQYYAGEGADDPLRISIPVGAYVPVFDVVDIAPAIVSQDGEAAAEPLAEPPEPFPPAAPENAPEPALERRPSNRWPVVAGLALCAALVALLAWYHGLPGATPSRPELASTPAGRPAEIGARHMTPAAPAQVTIIAISVSEVPSDPKLAGLVRRFASFLVDALQRFDDLVTVKVSPVGEPPPADADYILEIAVQTIDGTSESFGRLRSARDGRIVWSASSTRPLNADESDLPELARLLAIRLAAPFGIIHADIRQNATSGAMRCIYRAIDVRRTLTPEDHLAARNCFQELTEQDPAFYPAWTQLAFLTKLEDLFGLNPQQGSPLGRALAAALMAVRLAPSSGRAHEAMMDALFARGATEEAIKSGREALARNPYDSDIMAGLGARLIQLNRPAEGLQLVERAIELSSGHPPAYDFFAVLGAHLLGASRLAQGHGALLAAGDDPYALLGRAILASQTGNDTDKRMAVEGLGKRYPQFEKDPQLWLRRRGFSAEVITRILTDIGLGQP
jgi:tetratricopeptide (TPR) repeat protein